MMKNTISREQLNSSYFDKLEDQILKRLKADASTEEARQELIQNTGINDPKLLDEITELGIPYEGVIALRIYPLIMVAWSTLGIDDSERKAIERFAKNLGIVPESIAGMLIDHWTRQPPERLCFDAWKRYWRHLTGSMSPSAVGKLVKMTQEQLNEIADCSGGVLGIGRISSEEQKLIGSITSELKSEIELGQN